MRRKEEANSQGLEVASRELASKAEEQLPDNPTAARELAIEAWKRKQTKYARKWPLSMRTHCRC